MAVSPAPNPNTIPIGSTLSDRALVQKALSDPRRRMIVEMILLELDIADQRGASGIRFEVTITGRRICVVPQGKPREALLPPDWGAAG